MQIRVFATGVNLFGALAAPGPRVANLAGSGQIAVSQAAPFV
jgi:hypothetical protein